MPSRPEGGSVVVVGPGTRFLSGISYYSAELANALSARHDVAFLQLRELCPRFAYPGRARVGAALGDLGLRSGVEVYDGLDWHWGRSLAGALRFLRRVRPRVVVLQWWTATTAHSYLALAVAARRLGARVVVELHEIQDVGEAAVAGLATYGRLALGGLLRLTDGAVVHCAAAAATLRLRWPAAAGLPLATIAIGPLGAGRWHTATVPPERRGEGPVRLLYFGVVRPYKGLDDLADAFLALVAEGSDIRLAVVGEVWQGCRTAVDRLLAGAPGRVEVVDRYVSDAEAARHFASADAVVLPYRRSSGSGPLSLAMAAGKPVVTTTVGALVEATSAYTGAVLVRPADPSSLAAGIRQVLGLAGTHHAAPHSWEGTLERFSELFSRIGATGVTAATA